MDKQDIAYLMKWKRGTLRHVGPYSVRESSMGGWYVTLTETGETLRGPLDTGWQAEEAARRYVRLTETLA